MACHSPRAFFAPRGGRFMLVPEGSVLPGQSLPVHPDFAGIKGGFHPGEVLYLDCNVCRSCVFKSLMAKVAGMLCEADRSVDTAFLTLTYGRDAGSPTDDRADMAHKILTPPHIRDFREALRKDRHYGSFRSVIAGEYGDLYGRAHWHVILFGAKGTFPEFDYNNPLAHFKHWPHGHVKAVPQPGAKAFLYTAEYALKGMAAMRGSPHFKPETSQVHISATRRPVLGHEFIIEHATRTADFGIPPSFNLMPPGGNPDYRYTLKDRSRDLYIDHFLDRLSEAYPNDPTFNALDLPLMAEPDGIAFGRRGDPWMQKAVFDGLRRRRDRLNPDDPAKLLRAERAALVEKVSEQAASAAREEKRQAEQREASRVQRAKARNRALQVSFRSDPDDPFWDEYDADRSAVAALRSWKDF